MNWSANKPFLVIAAIFAAIVGGLLLFSRKCRKKPAVTDKNPSREAEIRKGQAAMRELVKRAMKARHENRNFEGEAAIIRNAMHVPGLGQVDFRWGTFKKATGQGLGVSKIIGAMRLKKQYFGDAEFNPRILYKVPEILARGTPAQIDPEKTLVVHDCSAVVLQNTHAGKSVPNWVFTAYPLFDESSGKNLSTIAVARLLKKRKKQSRE